jgi:circadian clock protein KaiC
LQENPTQLDRLRTGLGWPAADPAVEVMYRSAVDIYIDEWVHDLLETVERTQARRILIDSLMDLQMAAIDETRFREFMYSLAQRFSRQEITVLSTLEAAGPRGDGKLPASAISHLADNVITFDHHRDHDAMNRSLAVIKTRASSHDSAIRQFSISAGGISLATSRGADPQPRAAHEQ